MFIKLVLAAAIVVGGTYAIYRFTGDYTFLDEGDNVANHPTEDKFNVEVIAARVSTGLILIERPTVGIDAIDFFGAPEEKVLAAKRCGRIKVRRNDAGVYVFEGSGCFLDW
jgi:hypothetical protein